MIPLKHSPYHTQLMCILMKVVVKDALLVNNVNTYPA